MDAIVTARVPAEIKERGKAILQSIGATPTDLINAAYNYVLANGKLPAVSPSPEALKSQRRTLSKTQQKELKQRTLNTTFDIPTSYWEEKTDEERLVEALKGKYARTN